MNKVLSIPEPWNGEAGLAGQNALKDYLKKLPTTAIKIKAEQNLGTTRRCRTTLVFEGAAVVITDYKSDNFSVTSGIRAAIVCVAQQMIDPSISTTTYTSLLA